MDDYVRYAKLPVSYAGSSPNNIEVNMYAKWGNEVTTTYTGTWSTAFSGLAANGFHAISRAWVEYEDVRLLYTRGTTSYNYPSGAVDSTGQALTGYCPGYGCVYYIHPTTNNYNANTTYYSLELDENLGTYSMEVHDVIENQMYESQVPVGQNIAGYFRNVTVPNGASLKGYYNTNGQIQGQDIDCENAASGAFISYKIGFTLDDED